MENDIKYPLHLEFYGLPGCGKSTISHLLSNNLKILGYKIVEPSYEIDHVRGGKLVRRIYKIKMLVSLILFHHACFSSIVDIVKSNGYKGKDFVSQVVNVAQKISIYNSKISDDIVIWDQGLVQAAVSLSTNSNVSAADNLAKLLLIIKKTNIFSVYMKCDMETALYRMKMRDSNDSRVEKLTSLDEKIQMLKNIESCCNDVLNKPSCLLDCNSDSTNSIQDALLEKFMVSLNGNSN